MKDNTCGYVPLNTHSDYVMDDIVPDMHSRYFSVILMAFGLHSVTRSDINIVSRAFQCLLLCNLFSMYCLKNGILESQWCINISASLDLVILECVGIIVTCGLVIIC